MDIEVLFEDNHYIAVNKPNRLLVHSDETGDRTLADWVKNYIKEKYKKPGEVFLGVIHRLDRPVSGVIIFARTTKGLQRMNKAFQEREVEKTYWAITYTRPPKLAGKLENFLWKDSTKNKTKVLPGKSRRHPDAKKAILTYELISEYNHHCLLEIKPETGRPHQIRAQLAAIDCPITGDIKYGFPTSNIKGCIDLHSRSLSFIHPIKKEKVEIIAKPPKTNQVWNWFENVNSKSKPKRKKKRK